MQIVEKAPRDLKPYEKNPRKNDQAVPIVVASIKEFGFRIPIIIDKNDVIVCGHTRYKAALQMELETVPCIYADDLTDEQIRAFRIADNKTQEVAEWDWSILPEELAGIKEIDMKIFGFDRTQAESLDDVIEDDYREEKAETMVKAGELWRLGDHLIMCADSTDPEALKILMGGGGGVLCFYGSTLWSGDR